MVTEKGFGETAERVPGEYRRLSMWAAEGRDGGTAAKENGAAGSMAGSRKHSRWRAIIRLWIRILFGYHIERRNRHAEGAEVGRKRSERMQTSRADLGGYRGEGRRCVGACE